MASEELLAIMKWHFFSVRDEFEKLEKFQEFIKMPKNK